MRPLWILFGLVSAGCSLQLGVNHDTTRVRDAPTVVRVNDNATFVQDGVKWTCVIENAVAGDVPWRKTRKAICFDTAAETKDTK